MTRLSGMRPYPGELPEDRAPAHQLPNRPSIGFDDAIRPSRTCMRCGPDATAGASFPNRRTRLDKSGRVAPEWTKLKGMEAAHLDQLQLPAKELPNDHRALRTAHCDARFGSKNP